MIVVSEQIQRDIGEFGLSRIRDATTTAYPVRYAEEEATKNSAKPDSDQIFLFSGVVTRRSRIT